MEIIKALKDITGADLMTAKGYLDSCPATVKQYLSKREAEEMADSLEYAGINAIVQPM